MNYYTNQYEFKYYLRDENGTIDEGFLLTDVVSGVNKIMAEESFLDILKNRGVNPANVYIISAEIIPDIEETIELSFEQNEETLEDSFEYNKNDDEIEDEEELDDLL